MIREGKSVSFFLALILTLTPLSGVKFAFASKNTTSSLRTGEILLRLKDNPQIYKIKADEKNLDQLVAEYKKSPLVELAEPNQLFRASFIPDDQFYTKQTYHNQVFSLDAWDKTQGSSSVVIAIIDSGVDIDHPDLINNIWKNVDEIPGDGLDNDNNGFVDDVNGWDFVTGTPDPNPKGNGFFQQPPEGQAPQGGSAMGAAAGSQAGNSAVRVSGGPIGLNHGTVVAGVASAKGNNREGIAGVSWNSQIMPVRILDSGGFGDTINVVKGIDYAVVNGANIINLSFVGFDPSPLMDEAVLRAYSSNIIVVAAAGNDVLNSGANLDITPGYPICSGIENSNNILLGVGAVDSADLKARFSNYGTKCVDIAAPGVNFFSSQAQLTQIGLFDLYGDGWSGTSMATPLISGAAALLKAVKPTLTNREIIDILIDSSDSINQINPDFVGKLGRGRLNIFRALLAVLPAIPVVPTVPTDPPPSTPTASPTEPASPVMLNLPTLPLQAKNLVTVPAGLLNSQVQIYDLESSVKVRSFKAFPFVFKGGLNLAVGDIENDGFEEILVAPGEGGSPQVRIFDTKGNLKGQFFAGSSSLRGGATLVLADIDNDGIKEIIVGLGKGSAPEVKIFKKNGGLLKEFLAYPKGFKGGVSVAAGDLDNDGIVEIVTASGPGIIGSVKIFDLEGKLKSQFTPFINFLGGLSVAVADLGGDGFKEILVGPASAGGPQIKVFNSLNRLVSQFFAFDSFLRGGLSLAAGNLAADTGDQIIVGAGKNSEARVRVYDSRAQKNLDLLVYPLTYKGGVRLGTLLKIEN